MIPVKPHIAQAAYVKSLEEYQRLYQRSLAESDAFWDEMARRLSWFHSPERPHFADMKSADFEWFGGGKLNASFNCVDRHAEKTPDKVAIIWAGDEPGTYVRVTYRELARHVAR